MPGVSVFTRTVAAGCAYEVVALTTRKVPTLSELMWGRPLRQRALVWLLVVLIGTDHLLTRRWF